MPTESLAKKKPLTIAVITRDGAFLASALSACVDLGEPSFDGELPAPATIAEPHPLYVETLAKARRYLAKTGQALAIRVVQAATFDAAAERVAAGGAAAGPFTVLFVDAVEAGGAPEDRLEAFYDRLAAASIACVRSPYAVIVHHRTAPWAGGVNVLADRCLERVVVPGSPWLLRTEQLTALVDFVERTLDKPRNHKAALRAAPATLGDELTRFLCERAGASWLFFYYTGSSVTPLIDHVERLARERGVLALRAANEHGLASGALANHLLHERPFFAVVGTAMMDEMRGTLANLRSAGAKGFIVCPEAEPGSWFSFQGTITADEDMREVVAARRLPCVYLDRAETMPARLEEAFRAYEEGRGPVVLLVTQAILDARDPLERALVYPEARAPRPALGPAEEEALAKALGILNRERTRVLWQLGRLDAEEAELVHEIAARAGVALVDTLGHPHPTHRAGQPVRSYLGTLGLYGFNQRAHAFLHDATGKLHPRTEQCIFFLKSKVGGRATNFTPGRRSGLRMVQLTHRADHVAADVELALVMDAKDFLRRVRDGLDVDPEVLRHREAAIDAAAPPGLDVTSRLPSLPMSPNYFFRELGALVERMIAEDGYAYTGVYDVGRSSVSATRAVPRTARGFSGWYGRALMGDAPASLPTLAITEPGHLLAFIGDGGKSIVADPLPFLLDNALAYPERFDKNVTVFYLSNGTYSGIRTYRERLASRWGGRQVRTFDLLSPDAERRFGSVEVVHRTVSAFDAAALREALLARRRINVVTVLLGHNADDDGFSFVSAGWQRDSSD
jgi:thiamine pyrophosphate-dependent acetolactate synthase large subunit-like protein